MADLTEAIAPAVTSPQDLQPDSPPTKRSQPSPSPPPSKRQRLSTDSAESPSTVRESPKPIDKSDAVLKPTRKNSMQEERKRGQRLFGGLLSTLSQSSTGTQQKRRQDFEKRQQEKAKRQKIEDEGRRQEKLQLLKEIRTREMVSFEEESMHLRHSNMLAMAQFLQTKSEPKLYYKPWELLPSQSALIAQQITTAESTIARELSELAARKAATTKTTTTQTHPSIEPAKPQMETEPEPEPETLKEEEEIPTKGEKDVENQPIPDSSTTTTNDIPVPISTSTQPTSSTSLNNTNTNTKDHNEGEVVLEAAEDTVIY